MITKKLQILIILIILTIQKIYTANLLNSNSISNNRIQCEYKDLDGESLILNCTITNGLQTNNVNNNNNIDISSETSSLNQNTGQSSNSASIKVGTDRQWRTPWESLSINHNIISTLIWRRSRLTDLGEWSFKDLNYLQRIDLSHNKLQTLNSMAFNRFELNLIELDLSHNLFQQLSSDMFQSKRLQSIEVLRLNENPIVHLHRKPFEPIRSSLKTIELNYCQIRSIDVNTFDDMKQLESISMIGNHLHYLNEYTFRDLNLRSFYLHENPLVCDCHMRWLINYLKNVDYQQQTYESQIVLTNQQQQQLQQNMRNLYQYETISNSNANTYIPALSVAQAAQQLLKCNQPNSLKSKPNFLDINPDSFMCEVQISFRDFTTEGQHELGDDAILICDAYGDPEPNIYWSFGQKPIEKALINVGDKYHIQESKSYGLPLFKSSQSIQSLTSSTNKTSQLKIKNLQASDFGMYGCTAEISGSNNRKQIKYNLKQIRSGLSGSLVINGVQNLIAAATSTFFHGNGGKPLSSWTLLLLLAIVISLILFLLMLISFVCWKCKSKKNKQNELLSKRLLTEQIKSNRGNDDEKLLMSNQGGGTSMIDGHLVHHHQSKLLNADYQNPQMSNNSSATLIGNNNSSIRMAYPNGQHLNDIYANHSLLTTTSTTTGSYLANNNPAIAIDTSNHTPRYHLLHMQQQQQQLQQVEGYYDDLRYHLNDENSHHPQAMIYSSPYKNEYSPVTRRDDPTVPLYATLKPKLHHQQQQHHLRHQQQQYYASNNYLPYTTIQRNNYTNNKSNTPPLPLPRNANTNNNKLSNHLPPPPPPPPLKPKRTFEYVIGTASRDLHSESGAFLLASDDYEQTNELLVCAPNNNNNKSNKIKQNNKHLAISNNVAQGSTTSLDEEDLDLNDLKDFEDVTFDNLRKPGQTNGRPSLQKTNRPMSQIKRNNEKELLTNDDLNNNNNTNSEQSLLLKSSVTSSENNNEDNNNKNNTKSDDLKKSIITQSTLVTGSETSNSSDVNCNSDELSSKIYEETEI
jgi:hypothetical protein